MLVHERHRWNLFWGVFAVLAAAVFFLWPHLPKQDPAAYFQFADQRSFLGIPNFFDVISNLAFVYIGLWGLLNASSMNGARPKGHLLALFFVNLSVFLTGWGSSYFHMDPTPVTLVWDRAPMAMGFMALLTLILMDRVASPLWQVLLLPLMALGVWAAWQGGESAHDIRYYLVVQFGGLLLAVILVVFRRPNFLNNKLMYFAFGCYALAKVLEMADGEVLERFVFSGHTVKHLIAALAIFAVNLALQIPPKNMLFK